MTRSVAVDIFFFCSNFFVVGCGCLSFAHVVDDQLDDLLVGLFDCWGMCVVSLSQEMESNCIKHIYTRD